MGAQPLETWRGYENWLVIHSSRWRQSNTRDFVGLKPQKFAPRKLNGGRATFVSERSLRPLYPVKKYSFGCTAQGWPGAWARRRTGLENLASVPHATGISTPVPFGTRVAVLNRPKLYREVAIGFQILIAIHRNRHSHQVQRISALRDHSRDSERLGRLTAFPT